MKLLAHRGLWQKREHGNSLPALRSALAEGMGIETDVRDHNGRLVISHDLPKGDEPDFSVVLDIYRDVGATGELAINIKSDGLVALLAEALDRYDLNDRAFVFDMSVPDTIHYLHRAFRAFHRRSEIEPEGLLSDRTAGVWLDFFAGDEPDFSVAVAQLDAGKQVAIVSPELHRKPHLSAWSTLRETLSSAGVAKDVIMENCMLCTDLPHEAIAFFDLESATAR